MHTKDESAAGTSPDGEFTRRSLGMMLSVLFVLAACTTPAPSGSSAPVLPVGTFPSGYEGLCNTYLAALQNSNDEGASGRIYDPNDAAIQERLTRAAFATRVPPRPSPGAFLNNPRGGDVILGGIIERNGKVSNISVLQSVRGFDDSAVEALGQWTFQPARIDGRFVRSFHCTRFTFNTQNVGLR